MVEYVSTDWSEVDFFEEQVMAKVECLNCQNIKHDEQFEDVDCRVYGYGVCSECLGDIGAAMAEKLDIAAQIVSRIEYAKRKQKREER